MRPPVANRGGVLVPGSVTTIGSLPHGEVEAAARFVLDRAAAIPAAPQLPRRSVREGMLAQVAALLPVNVRPDGTLAFRSPLGDATVNTANIDVNAANLQVNAANIDVNTAELDIGRDDGHRGLATFLDRCEATGWAGPVKLQLAGPVTLGIALCRAGAPPAEAFPAALAAVRATARAMVAAARSALPGVELLCWLDEPGLVAWPDVGREARPDVGLDRDRAVANLSAALDAIGPGVLTGVHCCGPTDWGLVSAAGATVLSLPVELPAGVLPADSVSTGPVSSGPVPAGHVPAALTLDAHLRRGGWLAWGAVPTDRPVGRADEPDLWAALERCWATLTDAGCDARLLRQRAMITPVCGLAGLDVEAADIVVELALALGRRAAIAAAG